MSIRVTYDSQIFRLQRQGGISRYFSELISAYRREPDLGVRADAPSLAVASRHVAEAGIGRRIVLPPRVFKSVQTLLPIGTRSRERADLVHHTYYLPRELDAPWPMPRVTTIHDMIPELMPEWTPEGDTSGHKRSYVNRSSGLLFVSETSRRDLFRLYGSQDVPTAVAPLAAGPAFYPRRSGGERSDRYVVFVGKRHGYKEFGTLLSALAQLPAPGLSLVAVGGGPLSSPELAQVDELGLRGRVAQATVSDGALADIYSSAVALVVPSRYEGFGLPVVEAMATGCPVIVSDIPVFWEVADDAAEYFPVGDATALAAALHRMERDQSLRRSRREDGLLRVKDFSWSRTAAVTATLYREALADGRR